jgi:hypothetical protein
MSLVFCGEL